MSKEMLFVIGGLVLGAWFVIDENRSMGEKIGMIMHLAGAFLIYQFFFNGPSFMEFISPLIRQPSQ
jgi:hypothetical protein